MIKSQIYEDVYEFELKSRNFEKILKYNLRGHLAPTNEERKENKDCVLFMETINAECVDLFAIVAVDRGVDDNQVVVDASVVVDV